MVVATDNDGWASIARTDGTGLGYADASRFRGFAAVEPGVRLVTIPGGQSAFDFIVAQYGAHATELLDARFIANVLYKVNEDPGFLAGVNAYAGPQAKNRIWASNGFYLVGGMFPNGEVRTRAAEVFVPSIGFVTTFSGVGTGSKADNYSPGIAHLNQGKRCGAASMPFCRLMLEHPPGHKRAPLVAQHRCLSAG